MTQLRGNSVFPTPGQCRAASRERDAMSRFHFAVQGFFFFLLNVNISQSKGKSGLGPSDADHRAPFVTE